MYQHPNNGHGQGPPSNRGGFNQAPPQYGQQYPQQPPFGQQQYGRPGYQGGFNQSGQSNRGAHHTNTYPPPKRQKGNPVITRYAPPPGYQAPPPGQPWQAGGPFRGQPPGPQGQAPYQQQTPSFQRPSGPPSFQNGWQPQQNQFGGAPMMQSPQTYTNPSQQFGPQRHQGAQSYPQHFAQQQGYQGQHPQQNAGAYSATTAHPGQGQQQQGGWQGSSPAQNGFPAKNDSFSGSPLHGSPPRQGSGIHSGRGSVGSITSMPPPPVSANHQETAALGSDVHMAEDQATAGAEPDPNDPLNMKEHDWTFDPEGAIWPKATEVVDNSLSLGLIAWHPGTRMTRAIPSTFAAAEQFSRAAPLAPIGLGDSISTYFMIENHENAYDNITSLAHWGKIKNDPIFVSFPPEYESLPVAEVKEWRNRADVFHDYTNDVEEEGEIELEGANHGGPSNGVSQQHSRPQHQLQSAAAASQAQHGQRGDDGKASRLDQSQEDILASLGVEGPARPVYPTPGPAYGTQSAEKSGTEPEATSLRYVSQNSAAEPYTQPSHQHPTQQDTYPPPDDPIEQAIARALAGASSSPQKAGQLHPEAKQAAQSNTEPHDPWNPDHGMPDAHKASPTPSNKTHTGSDFGHDGAEANPTNGHRQTPPPVTIDEDARPPLHRNESSASRKRSYDNFNDQDAADGASKRRQSNDGGRPQRPTKAKQNSDDAYSRRW